jgi:hypothetical protein
VRPEGLAKLIKIIQRGIELLELLKLDTTSPDNANSITTRAVSKPLI